MHLYSQTSTYSDSRFVCFYFSYLCILLTKPKKSTCCNAYLSFQFLTLTCKVRGIQPRKMGDYKMVNCIHFCRQHIS